MTNGLHAIDWILICCYASGMVALGWYYGRRQRDTDEYYTGNRSIDEMRKGCRFVKITGAGLRESHVHDVIVTKEAPNYRLE